MIGFILGFLAGGAAAGGAALWHFRRQGAQMGRFFSFAAHEINTPITAVNMTILNLLSGVFGDISPDQVQWIEMMREQLTRLNGMVGELRDLIHMELKNDLLVHLEDIPAAEAVETAVRAVRFGCAHANVVLEVSMPEDLPPLRADPDRLPRTVISLLFHARKFRADGPINLSAAVSGDRRSVELTVAYKGPKLTQEEADQSLELYFPARQRKDQNLTATGLGLGILKNLTELQGGGLRIEADGSGACRLKLTVPAGSANVS